jgi:hypothetical protein
MVPSTLCTLPVRYPVRIIKEQFNTQSVCSRSPKLP